MGCRSLASAEPSSTASLFPDQNLEAVVRKHVFEKRDTTKPLVEADVANLSTIEGKGAGITNLAGLEKCVSLASLDLARNQIQDLTALKGLERLQLLNLADNQIEDITPLANVPALQYLELSRNEIRTITPLQGLTNLASLYLSVNLIRDPAPILALPKLSSLYLDENAINSLDGINRLKGLSTLSVRGNSITDLEPLRGRGRLSWLFLERNKLRDLGPLLEMVQADKEQRFAPFLNVYFDGNPLRSAAINQIAAMKKIGTRVHGVIPSAAAPPAAAGATP